MIQPTQLRAVSLDENARSLSWVVLDTPDDAYLDYEIQVVRSESSEGPFEPVSGWFRGHYTFVDSWVPTGNRTRQLHYRLRYRNKRTGETGESGSFTQEPLPDLKALEMRRHLQVLFQEHSGRRAWLLPARTFGRRCPTCWNPVLQHRTRTKCEQCFDTGFLGGYLYPIEIFVDIDPSGTATHPSHVGVMQPNTTTARMGHHPGVKELDVIVEGENNRWIVVSVTQSEHLRAPIMQQLQLRQVFPKDMEMRIPLELGQALESVWLSPRRAYTEAQDLGGTFDLASRFFFGSGRP